MSVLLESQEVFAIVVLCVAVCCVIILRRHVSPRPSFLHLDYSQHNANAEVCSGVLSPAS